jgi:hypothetical protein
LFVQITVSIFFDVVPGWAHLTFFDLDGAASGVVAFVVSIVVHVAFTATWISTELTASDRSDGEEKSGGEDSFQESLLSV